MRLGLWSVVMIMFTPQATNTFTLRGDDDLCKHGYECEYDSGFMTYVLVPNKLYKIIVYSLYLGNGQIRRHFGVFRETML